MAKGITELILLLLCLVIVISEATNPGFKARATAKGIKYANKVAIAALSKTIRTLKIPDQSGRSGKIEYTVSNIRITSFSPPTSSMPLIPGVGLRWAVSNAAISIHADFHYKVKSWIPVSDHGSLDASMSGVSINLRLRLSKDSSGHLSISAAGCSAHISGMSLHFHGGASFIYNLLKGLFQGKIKDMLQSQLCNIANQAVNKDAKNQLKKLPMTVVLAKKFLLNYLLVAPPVFRSNYLETSHKGEIFWKDDVKEAPFSPRPLPTTADNQKMLYLWLSDYMASTLSYAAFQHGFLHYNLTAKDLPAKERYMLNTTCGLLGICIGKLIPQIGLKYPNTQVMLSMYSTKAPVLSIHKNFIGMVASGNIDMIDVQKDKQMPFLLTLNVTANFTITASLKGQLLIGQIKSANLDFGVLKSAVGKVNVKSLQFLMDFALKKFVIPEVNKQAAKGLVLPVTEDITFVSPQLVLQEGSLMVATDIRYKLHKQNAVNAVKYVSRVKQDMGFKSVQAHRQFDIL